MFFRKKILKSPEQKAAEALPKTKKVQYVTVDLKELKQKLDENQDELTKLEPVNYYASKDTFLQCTFFYNEDYSSVYFVVEYFAGDRAMLTTPYYKSSYELMKKALRFFGVQI